MVNRYYIQFFAYSQNHELYSNEKFTQQQIDNIFEVCESAGLLFYSKKPEQRKFVSEEIAIKKDISTLLEYVSQIKDYEG